MAGTAAGAGNSRSPSFSPLLRGLRVKEVHVGLPGLGGRIGYNGRGCHCLHPLLRLILSSPPLGSAASSPAAPQSHTTEQQYCLQLVAPLWCPHCTGPALALPPPQVSQTCFSCATPCASSMQVPLAIRSSRWGSKCLELFAQFCSDYVLHHLMQRFILSSP